MIFFGEAVTTSPDHAFERDPAKLTQRGRFDGGAILFAVERLAESMHSRAEPVAGPRLVFSPRRL